MFFRHVVPCNGRSEARTEDLFVVPLQDVLLFTSGCSWEYLVLCLPWRSWVSVSAVRATHMVYPTCSKTALASIVEDASCDAIARFSVQSLMHCVTRRKLQTPGNAEEHKKTRNTYNQPNRPNRQTSHTKHQALSKGQPGRPITPINTAAVHASAQQQPTISTHTRQGHHQIFSANAARCEAQEQYRRAG